MPILSLPPAVARRLLSLGLAMLGHLPAGAHAGAFSVSPMRLELGGAVRSAALTVRNEDTAPMAFQVRAMAWSQDDAGQDTYEESPELVHFPRMLLLSPGQEGVVRIGLRQPLTQVEKAFRLFVEELPPPARAPAGEPSQAPTQVRMLVRFGAPVFVRPLQPVARLEAEGLAVTAGEVRWRLRNDGNRHERLEAVRVRGFDARDAEVFDGQAGPGYLLAGRARAFALAMPPEACRRIVRLSLEVRTHAVDLRRALPADAAACP